ncbi:MAG: hypothetical protein JWO38_7788 [Gemmataceae bacterium]|nr:hypothetical protein [Gemmataceae bacterium]
MTGKRWLIAVGLGALFAGSGCVSCGHQACKPVLDAGPNCEVPACDRRHVYTVLINGLTPGGPSGLEGLRDRLATHGYEKVYYGQLCHVWWMWQEMKRVHTEDPSARFVIIGYDFGSDSAAGLARDAVAKGIPVDAVVLLDPSGQPDPGTCPVRTVMLRCTAGVAAPHADGIALCGATHLTLPTHPRTVEIVCELLKESAARVEHPPYYEGPEMTYDGAPPRAMPLPGPGLTEDWFFLHDQPGTHAVPLTPVPAAPFSIPPAPGTPGPWVVPAPTPPTGLPLPAPKKLGQGQ